MTKLSGQFSIERVHQSCTLVIPDCDWIEPDKRIAFGFHNLSRRYDALGHCVARNKGSVPRHDRTARMCFSPGVSH
ncbi:hypothetical protein [Paraburkholderia aromaticivorans]|uniref:hypothetical protein n=1 Tax=Paraburkholderia aromaticivorans TaxID=2026199 RepID=UPI001455E12C|nr:hypothetical protein [Paraburkholderia aromaticivorans]